MQVMISHLNPLSSIISTFIIHYIDGVIPLASTCISKISRIQRDVAEQVGVNETWLETQKKFLATVL